jgi:hypothetical protein
LQTAGALPVQALCRCGDGEASSKSRGTELGRTATWGKDGTDSDIFDEVGVDARTLDKGLEGTV